MSDKKQWSEMTQEEKWMDFDRRMEALEKGIEKMHLWFDAQQDINRNVLEALRTRSEVLLTGDEKYCDQCASIIGSFVQKYPQLCHSCGCKKHNELTQNSNQAADKVSDK